MIKRARAKKGLIVVINKNVPTGLGLGSSGATSAACTKALDELLGLKLSDDELVAIASLGEKAVSGSAHADNVAASLLGGFTAVYDNPLRVTNLKPTSRLMAVVATPRLETLANKTQKARSLVPRKIETKKAVLNVGRASALAVGFFTGNIEMIGAGMHDEIAEPYRQSMIPGYADVMRLALEAGAAGVAISGAGPSLIALLDRTKYEPGPVGRAMVSGFAMSHVRSTWFATRPAPGAKIIRKR